MTVCFYSNRCKHCQNIIQMINSEERVKDSIELIPIEHRKHPNEVKNIPAIIDNGNLFEGKQAFEFVENKINLQSFAFGADNSEFSFIDNGDTHGKTFTFIDDSSSSPPVNMENLSVNDNISQKDPIQQLIDQRNADMQDLK